MFGHGGQERVDGLWLDGVRRLPLEPLVSDVLGDLDLVLTIGPCQKVSNMLLHRSFAVAFLFDRVMQIKLKRLVDDVIAWIDPGFLGGLANGGFEK